MKLKDFEDGYFGVWRTIGGRRVFIRDGEDLSSAMRRSGKFKTENKTSSEDSEIYKKYTLKNSKSFIEDKLGYKIDSKIYLRNERYEHVKKSHGKDVEYLINNLENAIKKPTFIILDSKHKDSMIFYFKSNEQSGLMVCIKFVNPNTVANLYNSIITMWKVNNKRAWKYYSKINDSNKKQYK